LLVSGIAGDVFTILPGQNITVTGDAVNDRVTIGADLTSANGWANTKLSNGTVTLAGALTTTGSIYANGVIYVTPVGGQEGGEIKLQATGSNTNWNMDSYQNNFRLFAESGTTVSNVNFFHAIGGGSIRMGVNRADPGYTLDVNGIVNASAIYVNGAPMSSGSMDYPYANLVGSSANAASSANDASQGANIAVLAASFVSNSQSLSANVNTLAATFVSANANNISLSANVNVLAAVAAAALANTSGVSFNGNLNFPTGNVGIGTTTSSVPLTVTRTAQGTITYFNGPTSHMVYQDFGSASYLWHNNSQLYFGTYTANNLYISTNSNARITVTSAGDIGIGTTSPSSKLHVAGGYTILADHNTQSAPTAALGATALSWNYSGGNAEVNFWNLWNTAIGGGFRFSQKTGTSTFNDVYWASNTAHLWYTTGTERMRIASDGNIGIGTTAPTATLHVQGNANIALPNLVVGGTNVIAAIVASNANAVTLSSNVNTLAAAFVSNSQSLSTNVNTLAATFSSANANTVSLSANVNVLAAAVVANDASQGANIATLAAAFVSNSQSLSANVNTLAATFASANANSISLSSNVNVLAANVNTLAGAAYPKTGGTISGDVTVTGSLTVSGATTYVNTQTLLIGDNLVTLNADLPGNVQPTENAGLEINRGARTSNAAFIWNENANSWQFTSNTLAGVYSIIASQTDANNVGAAANNFAAATYLTQSAFNSANANAVSLSANVNTLAATFVSANANAVSLSANVNVLAAAVVANDASQGANIATLAAAFVSNSQSLSANVNTLATALVLANTSAHADIDALSVVANTKLANTSGVSFNGNLFFPSGNVGVGVITSALAGGNSQFTVFDSETLGGTLGNYNLLSAEGANGGSSGNAVWNAKWRYRQSAGTDWTTHALVDGVFVDASFTTPLTSKTWWFRFPQNGVHAWGDGATEYARMNSTGLGIGTTSPQTRLHVGTKVNDDATYTYDINTFMVVHQTPTGTTTLNDPKTVMMLARQGTGGQAYGAAVAFDLSRYENAGTSSVGSRTRLDITLANNNFIAQNTTVMTLLSGGNVGIGTTAPTATLHVQGNANIALPNLVVGGTNVIAAIVAANANAVTLSSNVNTLAASFVSNSQSLSANVNTLAATFVSANANAVSLSTNVNVLAASFVSNTQTLSANVNVLAATFVSANANNISLSTNVNILAANVNTLAGSLGSASLANTSGVSFNGNLFFPTGNVGIGAATTTFNSVPYKLYVNGSFAATTKSFVIDHPTKPGMKLRYGSLEGPENGVYVRGRLDGIKVIELPDYWEGLVDLNSITVQLTAIGHAQNLYVAAIDGLKIHIDTENHTQPYCFYTVFGERKDVEKLVVEY
jgi:hypothetical protein